ncbi:MAG: PQQ-dependent sugar dehydrogenase [Caldilineaceae bacterium]
MVPFGPDGYLYIGLGDGGSGDRYGNGQNPDSLLGKMLRIDVITTPAAGYTIPADNPWLTADWQGQEVRDEIWAVGLRNPWRYSFDRLTGDLWIGDVGQNQYEEIDFTPAEQNGGLNYGWPIMEGTHCYSSNDCDPTGLVMPVAEYSHSGHCSVTGGYVYRGVDFPMLTGVYLYGDYCSGTIWGSWPSGGVWQNAELLESGVRISSFGEDEAGELYITDMSAGQLLRLVVE